MIPGFLARSLHRWLGLLVGLQLVVWLATGVYMVVLDLDFIHGDPMVRRMAQPLALPTSTAVGMADLGSRYPGATEIAWLSVAGEPHLYVETPSERALIDPASGERVSPLDEERARQIAAYHFAGEAEILEALLIESDPPTELGSRPLPLWRIDFADRFATSFYVDPYSGALVTRRHRYWRIFDVAFMLHIMDYDERTDAHNALLKSAQVVGLLLAASGAWLLFYSFRRRARPMAGAGS